MNIDTVKFFYHKAKSFIIFTFIVFTATVLILNVARILFLSFSSYLFIQSN